MPVYPKPHDAQGLAREIVRLRRQVRAAAKRAVGPLPDPTPPPNDVTPGAITAWLIEHFGEEQPT